MKHVWCMVLDITRINLKYWRTLKINFKHKGHIKQLHILITRKKLQIVERHSINFCFGITCSQKQEKINFKKGKLKHVHIEYYLDSKNNGYKSDNMDLLGACDDSYYESECDQ